MKLQKSKTLICVVLVFLMSFPLGVLSASQKLCKIHGFVYNEDGTKPLKDAIVMIRENTSNNSYVSERSKKDGTYEISKVFPGLYVVGITYNGKDYNINSTVLIRLKKQIVCFTLPKDEGAEFGYMVPCPSPNCFFIKPCGWGFAVGVAGIALGVIKLVERSVSPTEQ
jgi:hypothetical protein